MSSFFRLSVSLSVCLCAAAKLPNFLAICLYQLVGHGPGYPEKTWHNIFKLTSNQTRGHYFKLYKQFSSSTVRSSFFAQRVINVWNSLQTSVDLSTFSIVYSVSADCQPTLKHATHEPTLSANIVGPHCRPTMLADKKYTQHWAYSNERFSAAH